MNPTKDMQRLQAVAQERARHALGAAIGGANAGELAPMSDYKPPSYRETLEARKAQLDAQSADLARALEILDKNPEIEELLSLVGRVI